MLSFEKLNIQFANLPEYLFKRSIYVQRDCNSRSMIRVFVSWYAVFIAAVNCSYEDRRLIRLPIQSTLVISTSVISYNRLSRGENLVLL